MVLSPHFSGRYFNTEQQLNAFARDGLKRSQYVSSQKPNQRAAEMANTNYYKTHVEPYVRAELERRHGVRFESKILRLTTGGTHEFDAVALDGSIVASIKSLSGKTASGKRPAAKYSTCLAELYFLSLVESPRRILVLTTPDWHTMFTKYIENRLAPGLEIELIHLPSEIQQEVDRVKGLASNEVSLSSVVAVAEAIPKPRPPRLLKSARVVSAGPANGCRDEILKAAAHLGSLGQTDFTPDEIIRTLRDRGTRYAESTIRTHVVSVMCKNAPQNHLTAYADLERVGHGRYRLLGHVE